jgi:hypothetical protein
MMTSERVAARTARRLAHTCTLIAPGAPTGVFDAYEEPIVGPDTETTGVACWCYQPPAQGEVVEPGRALVAHTWRVNVGPDAGATEAMRVAEVREQPTRDDEGTIVAPGRLLVAGPLAIMEIIRHRGHHTLVCAQATSGEVAP